jgi:hypothetical protein
MSRIREPVQKVDGLCGLGISRGVKEERSHFRVRVVGFVDACFLDCYDLTISDGGEGFHYCFALECTFIMDEVGNIPKDGRF